MTTFDKILTASGDQLLKMFYQTQESASRKPRDPRRYAHELKMTSAQYACALGFNRHIEDLPDIIALSGFETHAKLNKARNEYFTTDIYNRLGIKDVLQIYVQVTDNSRNLQVMQYLIKARLENIEARIEETVNSIVIERYKKEMRSIYNDGVAQLDFAEDRLANTNSGFRALLNEVVMIVESRLIPVGDIFFRENILPEEKRRLITRGLIPRNLVEIRLQEANLSDHERKVLEDQLRLM